jgi:hypothetical protein
MELFEALKDLEPQAAVVAVRDLALKEILRSGMLRVGRLNVTWDEHGLPHRHPVRGSVSIHALHDASGRTPSLYLTITWDARRRPIKKYSEGPLRVAVHEFLDLWEHDDK